VHVPSQETWLFFGAAMSGIVIDPKQHSFFSFVRSGPDTQFYDSPYWRSRGIARFLSVYMRRSRSVPANARSYASRGPATSSGGQPQSGKPTTFQTAKPAPASALALLPQLKPPVRNSKKPPKTSFCMWQGKTLHLKKSQRIC